MKILFESYKRSGKFYSCHETDVSDEYEQFDSTYDFWAYKQKDVIRSPDKYSGLIAGAYKQYGNMVQLVNSDGERIFSFVIYPEEDLV